jgi:uncharacterized Fe-S cluster-containing MiaB family protein
MFPTKKKAVYKITAEMLSHILFGEFVNIETIEFDKSREVLNVYVSGSFLDDKNKTKFTMAEGDEHTAIKIFKREDGSVEFC